ncbi:MAG: 16S rRNA processing protein RimM [Acetobacteraceae bacterium]|nr:16S rRNA processing protein RimM [Acetobacteraceae bacterium]
MSAKRLLLGQIGRPHGVRGLVRVQSFTADPGNLTAYGPLSDDHGRQLMLRWNGEGVAAVSVFEDGEWRPVTDRTSAESLANQRLYLDRAKLPPTQDEEFYFADLVGLVARDPDGKPVGKVLAVHDYGAGASLEITSPGTAAMIVPFTRTCVPVVDLARGWVVISQPIETELRRQQVRPQNT